MNRVLMRFEVMTFFFRELTGGFALFDARLFIGTTVVDAFRASLDQPNHFDLIFDAPFTSNEQVREAIYDEQAWAAVVGKISHISIS